MRKEMILAAATVLAAGSLAVHAADANTVKFFKETCGICHGENAEGTPGLAPALKGNAWVKGASDADIATTITKGREGAAKRHKDIPGPMPANSMSENRLKNVTAYLKELNP
jgi:mono/diheme cytochrome c family protein